MAKFSGERKLTVKDKMYNLMEKLGENIEADILELEPKERVKMFLDLGIKLLPKSGTDLGEEKHNISASYTDIKNLFKKDNSQFGEA